MPRWINADTTSTGDVLGVYVSADGTEVTIRYVNADPGDCVDGSLTLPIEDWPLVGKYFFAVNKEMRQENIQRRRQVDEEANQR